MRGPNKTGRRGSLADMDAAELSGTVEASEVAGSPTSSSSRRSPSEVAHDPEQRVSGATSRARSGSGSPASQVSGLPSPPPTARERTSVSIALPLLSNGNLSLQYPMSSSLDHPTAPTESVIRYAQSMPHIGYRYGQDFLRQEQPAGVVWNPALDLRMSQ
jgi:hypothetical protein